MIVDCHVHVCADTPGHGGVAQSLVRRWNFRALRWLLGIRASAGAELEHSVEAKLLSAVEGTPLLDAVVVLALDAVYDRQGQLDRERTNLYVSNDYAWELSQRHPKLLFGASVHPYRPDAVAELERCAERGCVLMKWLPVVQDFNPADRRCLPFYEALARHRIPLLSHTGGEQSLPEVNGQWQSPELLVPALEAGVTVIAAHCGTHALPFQRDYTHSFVQLVRRYDNLYGDTAALNQPTRSHAYPILLKDETARQRIVHGSDWPLLPLPPRRIGLRNVARLLWRESNWLRRDVLIKQQLGLDDAYWHRAGTLLRLPASPGQS